MCNRYIHREFALWYYFVKVKETDQCMAGSITAGSLLVLKHGAVSLSLLFMLLRQLANEQVFKYVFVKKPRPVLGIVGRVRLYFPCHLSVVCSR